MPYTTPVHLLTDDRETYCGADCNLEPAVRVVIGAIANDEDVCMECCLAYQDRHGEPPSLIEEN